MSRSVHLDHGSDEITANVVWELHDPDTFWEYQIFHIVEGSLSYHYQSHDPDTGCEAAADANLTLGASGDDTFLSTNSGVVKGGRERSYSGYARTSQEYTLHGGCPDPDVGWVTFTDQVQLGEWWQTRGWLPHQADAGGPLPVLTDGTTMDGEFTDRDTTYRWHFTASRQ